MRFELTCNTQAQSKLANILYAKQLQKKFDTDNVPVTVIAAHPGYVDTEGFRKDPTVKTPLIGPMWAAVLALFFATPSRGAHSTVFAAASPVVRANRTLYKGAYVAPDELHGGRISKPPNAKANDAGLAEELWLTTERVVSGFNL